MPQEFQVVKCQACETFQVDIVKKTPKWKCKICGISQTLVNVYLNADAKTCRVTVQNLNAHRGQTILNSHREQAILNADPVPVQNLKAHQEQAMQQHFEASLRDNKDCIKTETGSDF